MLQNLFKKKDSKYTELHLEARQRIASYIAETRYIHIGRILRLPNDYDVLDALYRLAIYTFNNFEVPKSHYDYITNHIKGIQIGKNQSETVNSILEHWKKVDDIFGIELELRAIEVVYSYGNFPVTNEAYIITLIDEIRKGINRKEPMEYKHYGLTPPDVYNELIKRIPGLKN